MLKVTTTLSAHGQPLAAQQDIFITTETFMSVNGLMTSSKQSADPNKIDFSSNFLGLTQPSIISIANASVQASELQAYGESCFKTYLEGLKLPGVTSVSVYNPSK